VVSGDFVRFLARQRHTLVLQHVQPAPGTLAHVYISEGSCLQAFLFLRMNARISFCSK